MEGLCFMEDMIHVAEEEQKLFESILAVDFRKAEILREAQILNLDEADGVPKSGWENAKDASFKEAPAENSDDNKSDSTDSDNTSSDESKEAESKVNENIGKKIVNILVTIGKKIKAAFEALIDKMKRILLNDSKVKDKYLKAINVEGILQGFPGIDNFEEPNLDFDIPKDAIEEVLAPYTNILKYMDIIDKDSEETKKKVDGIIAGYASACKKPVDNWNKDGNAHFQFEAAINKLLDGKITKPIFYICKMLEVRAANAIQFRNNIIWGKEKFSAYFKESIELCKSTIAVSKKYFGSIRRALITCGTYALKKQNASLGDSHTALAVQDAADMAFMADMACEAYLEEQFAYI